MADTWSASLDAASDGRLDVFEVPLTREDDVPTTGEPASKEPNWRRAVAISLVAGSVTGIVGSIMLFGDDNDADTPAQTTLPADALSARITTPPTLRPLDTLPPPDDPALAREPIDEGPQPTTSQDRSLFDSSLLPTYRQVFDVGLPELVQYDVAAAVDRLGDDVSRRSETHVELGDGGFVLDVVIERDPVNDRYRVEFTSGSQVQSAIVDVESGITTITTIAGDSFVISSQELLEGTSASSINEYFDRMLLGPVRPDTFNAAATRGRSVVTIGDVRIARQFLTVVRGELIPEWQIYAFGPVSEFRPTAVPDQLEYAVYVTDGGRVAQVDGVSEVDGVSQLITHRLVLPDEPIVIELPGPPTVDAPATSAPATTVTPEG